MPLNKFIPTSPDLNITKDSDMGMAQFGHLNTIVDYLNTYVAADSLQLEGVGPLSATARYITDSAGTNSIISISTTRVGIGTNTPSAELHIDGHNGFGSSLKITTNKVGGVAYVQMISDYVTGIEQYQYGGPGWGWPNWTTTRAGGTAAAPTAVPSNYGLNEYTFWGHDGTAGGQAYSMMTRTSETWTPTAHGIYTTFNTVATGSTSLVERMRFTGTGNITFNNASDTAKVAIKGSGSTSATTSLLVQNSSATTTFYVDDAGNASANLKLSAPTVSGTSAVNAGANPYFGAAINAGISGGGALATFQYGTTAGGAYLQFIRDGAAAGGISSSAFETYDLALGAGNFGSTLGIAIRPANIGGVKIGGSNSTVVHVDSAILNVESTTKGFLPPRMTTAQKNLIASPAIGLQIFDTDLNRPCFYNGAWVTL
jgi:hypothetical protein